MLSFVERALDDDLVGADAVHLVVDALAALVQLAFDLQGGELVGHDAHAPALLVGPGLAIAVGEDLGRRVAFVPLAERAEDVPTRRACSCVILQRPLGALRGDDHPAADDRVFPQLGHALQSGGDAATMTV